MRQDGGLGHVSSAPVRPTMPASAEEVAERRRVREVRKYYVRSSSDSPISGTGVAAAIAGVESAAVSSPNTTLTALVQLIAWRLGMQRAMVSVVDENAQYFLAESTKTLDLADGVQHEDGDALWMGCGGTIRSEALCANTIERLAGPDKYACFSVSDLSKDERFCRLPYVANFPHFRYYAGTPLITRLGVPIGSVFVIDDRPRGPPTKSEIEFLGIMARNVMEYLELRRENEMKVRVDTMSKGMVALVDGRDEIPQSVEIDNTILPQEHPPLQPSQTFTADQSSLATQQDLAEKTEQLSNMKPTQATELAVEAFPETIPSVSADEDDGLGDERLFLRAANILRQALGVSYTVFFDARGSLAPGDEALANATPIRDGVIAHENNSSQGITNSTVTATAPLAESSDRPTPKQGWDEATTVRAATTNRQASKLKLANILAFSSELTPYCGQSESPKASPVFHSPELRSLRQLLKRYPTGKLWNFSEYGSTPTEEAEEDGFLSSSSISSWDADALSSQSRTEEVNFLMTCFPGVTQILFAPLFEAAKSSHIAACFAVSLKQIPVFTTKTETAYMRAFMNSISMACGLASSRASNKQKGGFISSISHELRSPLHGIIASVELLAATTLDRHQKEYCDIIATCGQVLLDTISDILEYTKINSMRKDFQGLAKSSLKPSAKVSPDVSSSERSTLLKIITKEPTSLMSDVALLCEDAVGIVAAAHALSSLNSEERFNRVYVLPSTTTLVDGLVTKTTKESVPIILEIFQADWDFVCLPGAFQRIVMNLAGNSLKYTESGFIQIHLSVKPVKVNKRGDHTRLQETLKREIVLEIHDSGKGISSDYLKNKLFKPFSQESILAPGTGLGLHIVRNLVQMHNGTVHVKSQIGKGTSVTVTLPLTKPAVSNASKDSKHFSASSGSGKLSTYVSAVRKALAKGTFAIYGFTSGSSSLTRDSLEKYLSQWLQMSAVSISRPDNDAAPEIIIIDEESLSNYLLQASRVDAMSHLSKASLIVVCDLTRKPQLFQHISKSKIVAEILTTPFGPHKLFQVLLASLEAPISPPDRAPVNAESQAKEDENVKNKDAHQLSSALSTLTVPTTVGSQQFSQSAPTSPVSSLNLASKSPLLNDHHLLTIDNSPPQALTSLPLRPQMPTSQSVLNTITPTNKASSASATENTNPTRILCVDDNPINLRLLKTYLEKLHYFDITCATNGATAFEAVRRRVDGFELIFMDLSMPVLDGFSCMSLIRGLEKLIQRFPSAPEMQGPESNDRIDGRKKLTDSAVIVAGTRNNGRALIAALTGLASQDDQDAALEAGADHFITKPLKLARLKELLGDWGFALPSR